MRRWYIPVARHVLKFEKFVKLEKLENYHSTIYTFTTRTREKLKIKNYNTDTGTGTVY